MSDPVRTVHHLSCTGRTLIAKFLAAMPGTLLLNEVDPLGTFAKKPPKPRFSPTDLPALLRQGQAELNDELLIRIFLGGFAPVHQFAQESGLKLILRDHSHGQFLRGDQVRPRPGLLEIVRTRYEAISVVTVRDPVDSFLSMAALGWNAHFAPNTFDEYCRRYCLFLDLYREHPRFRYEDFVARPNRTLKEICAALSLTFSPGYRTRFAEFELSGDSGRASSVIQPRPRRAVSGDLMREAADSENYRRLIDILGYPPVTASAPVG